MRNRWLLRLAAPVLLAACGTTVPMAGTTSPGSDATTGGANAPGQPVVVGTSPSSLPAVEGSGAVTGGAPAAGSRGGPSAPTASGSSSGPGGAATKASTGVLPIGITYIDNSDSSAALGFKGTNTVNAKRASEGLVRGFNLAGGLAGRRLAPVAYSFNGQSSSYTTQASAACAKFTQDTKVTVVLDSAFGNVGGFRQCMAKAGVMVIASQDEGDEASSRAAPLHANTAQPTTERAYSAVLRGMVSTGYLSRANQLGVVVEDCPENTNAYTKTLVPLIAQLGQRKAQTYMADCTSGFTSAGPAASTLSSAVLAFRGSGVDRVMFVSSANESVILYLFGPVASSQGYRPGYLLSSSAQTQAIRPSLPKDQWPQLHGVGNVPVSDVDGARPSAVDTRCRKVATAGGTVYASYQDGAFIFANCGPFLLLEAALSRANGSARASDLAASIASLGSAFRAPGVIGSSTFFSTSRRDGPAKVQVFSYVSSCTCMRYSGSPTSLAH